ncbi:PBSX family phage terminase large subunit [Furfurilactobacillus entadae]|uniref:PBSX family phage terminase large subunit n=1 Tax=Furfurilactobacillus entadae TaxID=2922307 RepID=UPI0035E813CA
MNDRDANAVVLRKVYGTIRESSFEQYLWAIDCLGVSALWKASMSPMQLTYVPTGQQIRFKGADKPEKIKSQKFRHGYMKFKQYEEVTEFRGMRELRSINQSLDRGGTDIITFYSYNPPESQNNWVNQAVEQAKRRADTLVSATTYLTVNPEWLGNKFIADAAQLKRDNEKAYRHEYLGEVTGTGAEVFGNLEQREVTLAERVVFDRYTFGLDFGFAHDPLAFVVTHYDKKHRILYLLNEVYQVGMTNRQAVAAIESLNEMNDPIIGDAAEPRTINEFNELGLKITGAKKGPGSVEHGTKWLADLTKIVIDPLMCPNAAREFSGYELDRDVNGNFKAGYPDRDNHAIDAVRYAMNDVMNDNGTLKITNLGGRF